MLADLPVVFILVGLVAYTVLAGADFGAGFWMLAVRAGRAGRAAAREHARHAMGPVWEANHVWLIFILVVCWTAYPVAFASITSTLAAPLLLAVIGIILRGAAYALRGQLDAAPGRRPIERLFALSSVLTPFALGTVVGAIATGRVPPGNAQGDPVTSWLNPTSIALGVLAVATSAYLAAVYLAADAHRLGERALELDFRGRALRTGVCTGVLALVSVTVVNVDVGAFGSRLTAGGGLAMVVVSAVAGLGTLVFVWRGRFEPARVSAALAVAAIIVGWAFAQQPWFLPGLTIGQAAAGRSTLVAITVAVAIGAIVLVPSLLLLFALHLRGRFDEGAAVRGSVSAPAGPDTAGGRPSRLAVAATIACLALGTVLLVFADSGAVHLVGIVCLAGGALATFVHVATLPDTA
ncbi:MAG TPA: cytochrome d ubiquinol oxidase subunit II [Pseudonocardia sp.]|uniref:cytochrome d ubiquinol oxidase subunit II n=1 Tax=Pseudonocardia sp. TaxID=60912 RepID=UPI002B7EDF9B|nr:cytochrome d ubiquinol oxidase subunit II [Pseudonocardia sp.]HTF49670.1 cytochrome d ubiquinol oxidase subunit II [Pseudonocardia sp.]